MDTPAPLAAKVLEQQVEDLAGHRALAEPLPGALKDAFSLAPDITVGPYKVRRFRDGDFKILAALDNPLNDFLRACLNGDKTGAGIKVEPTGQAMWDIAYVFTRPAIETAKMIRDQGVQAFQEAAEIEFSELRMAALAEILGAIIDQAHIYATANIAYDYPAKEGDDGASRPNPPSSAAK